MSGPLTIGMTCYPSVGGSGVVATELGNALARAGHRVHFISYEPPFRLDRTLPNIRFHQVKLNEYRLFKYPDYTLPLAVKMCAVHLRHSLDILHVHYAVPHATAALLARQILGRSGTAGPRIVTTLHGTDISLLGRDPSLRSIICYSIAQSDGVTAVSASLERETRQVFPIRKRIAVIPNFFTPLAPTRTRLAVRRALGVRPRELLVIHLSNLRPVKRIPDLLASFAALPKTVAAKLLILAGDTFAAHWKFVARLGLRRRVIVREKVFDIENYLNAADLGLYASSSESFGMGILETMSFGHPVVATKVGGIPEVVQDGKTGLLVAVGNRRALTAALLRLCTDAANREQLGAAAKARAARHFSTALAVDRYVGFYAQVLRRPRRAVPKSHEL